MNSYICSNIPSRIPAFIGINKANVSELIHYEFLYALRTYTSEFVSEFIYSIHIRIHINYEFI